MQIDTKQIVQFGRQPRRVIDMRQPKRAAAAAAFPWSTLSFGYTTSSGGVTIHAGSIRLHGIGNYAVAETDVTLTGATEWVYVEQSKSTPASTSVKHSATEPATNTSFRRLPLFKFTNDGSGYVLAQICHMGDFNFDAPIS